MESYDNIKKQIDSATKTLKKLLASISKTIDVDENVDKIDKALKELIDLNLKEITDSPIEQFVPVIIAIKKLNFLNLDLLAELLYESGLLLLKQLEKEKSKRLFNRALSIYQYLLKAEDDFTYERHIKIKKLKEILLQ